MLATSVAATAAGDWRTSLQQAVTLHQAGDLNSASVHHREALNGHEPLRSNWAVLTNAALAMQPESAEEAVHTFQRVIEIQPDNADSYFNLGTALCDCKEREADAVDAFKVAIQLNPSDGGAHYNLGTTQLQLGGEQNTADALSSLTTATQIEPDEGKNWHSLGDARAASSMWPESVEAYRRATALRPGHSPSWASLGNALEEISDGDAAIAAWQRALKLHPQARHDACPVADPFPCPCPRSSLHPRQCRHRSILVCF